MTATEKQFRSKKSIATGLIIITIGILLFLRKAGVLIPGWIFSWQMLLIGIGLSIGVSTNFKKPASWILIVIGSFFMLNEFFIYPIEIRQYFWPVLIIIIGTVVLLKPRRHLKAEILDDSRGATSSSGEWHNKDYQAMDGERIDSVSVFNGIKKRVTSKNFKGGEAVAVFGGSEFNLREADFSGKVQLELVTIFGGMKIIVPPGWEVRTNITSIFGGVEDKRVSAVTVEPDNKTLVLTGAVIFGGVDIVSY